MCWLRYFYSKYPVPYFLIFMFALGNGRLFTFQVITFFQLKPRYSLFKELFNCKTRMPGTVKCRPTVAYWVQIDGINIATELITRYYLNETLIQCCFNARPTSATLAQHWTNIELMYNVWEKVLLPQQTQDICITFTQRRPNVFDVGPALHKVIQMFCLLGCQYKLGVKQFQHPRSNTVSLFASQRPSGGQGKELWIINS